MSSAQREQNVSTLSHTQAFVQSAVKDWKMALKKSSTRLQGKAQWKLSRTPTVNLFCTSFGGFLNEADCTGMPYKTSPQLPFWSGTRETAPQPHLQAAVVHSDCNWRGKDRWGAWTCSCVCAELGHGTWRGSVWSHSPAQFINFCYLGKKSQETVSRLPSC